MAQLNSVAENLPPGTILKMWRQHFFLSLRQLSDLIDVDFGDLCRFEHGQRAVSLATIDRFLELVDLTRADFYSLRYLDRLNRRIVVAAA